MWDRHPRSLRVFCRIEVVEVVGLITVTDFYVWKRDGEPYALIVNGGVKNPAVLLQAVSIVIVAEPERRLKIKRKFEYLVVIRVGSELQRIRMIR